jgi:glycosyltransferase involved in cell wall biosynthesis
MDLFKLVTVIIPCYNDGRFLAEAIESAYKQANVIVVDDGSTDNSLEIASKYPVTVIRVPHVGLSEARNIGIRAAKTPYILPLDADDILLPISMDAVRMLAEYDIGVVYGNYQNFGDSEWLMKPNPEIEWEHFLVNNQLYPTSLFKKTAWESVGGYWKDAWTAEDWDFWARLFKHGWRFEYIDYAFAKHRLRHDSKWTTEVREGREKAAREMILNHIQ